MAAAGAFCKTCIEINFEFGIRQHDRANIATDHYHSIPLCHCTLLCNQNSSHFGMCGDGRDGGGDGGAADFPGDIMATRCDGILASISELGTADDNLSILG